MSEKTEYRSAQWYIEEAEIALSNHFSAGRTVSLEEAKAHALIAIARGILELTATIRDEKALD
jgi:hypothetical protein